MTEKVLFIHHSTGGLLLYFGNVRRLLKERSPNIELWDHGYNLYPLGPFARFVPWFTFHTGLSDSNGRPTGTDFNIVISNNSPKEYADIFNRKPNDFNLSNILKFDVIIFKNCFPTTRIETTKQLDAYKTYYRQILRGISRFSNTFIIFTPPPLRSEVTKPEWANHARNLADWLVTQKQKNIAIFNLFDLLSDMSGDNAHMLRREYCNPIWIDSHPNIKANRKIGKLFVDFLIDYSSR